MRLSLKCKNKGQDPEYFSDVGLKELRDLKQRYKYIEVIGWGRYGSGCEAYMGDEHKEILKILEMENADN